MAQAVGPSAEREDRGHLDQIHRHHHQGQEATGMGRHRIVKIGC